jgi:hypothetical protein
LREHDTARRAPRLSLPELPGLGLGVNKVIENGLLIKVGLVGADLGKRSVAFLEDFAVEALTIISLEETTESPGEAVHKEVLKGLLVKSLNVVELQEAGSKEGKHLSHTDNSGDGHNVSETLLNGNNDVVGDHVFLHEEFNPILFLRSAESLLLLAILYPSLEERLPAEISRGDVNDTATGHGSRGGIIQVLDLESHLTLVGHGNTLSVSKSQNPVIIKHGVKVLNPNSIDGTITVDPVNSLVTLGIANLPNLGIHAGYPLTSDVVHNTIHLLIGNSLRVHFLDFDLIVTRNVTKGLSKNVHDGSLTATGSTNKHETVTHEGSLVQLNDLNVPGGNRLQVQAHGSGSSDEILNALLDLLVLLVRNVFFAWGKYRQ